MANKLSPSPLGDRAQEPYFYATDEAMAFVPLEIAIEQHDLDGSDDITVDARHLRTILDAYRTREKQSREALPEWVEDEIDGVRRLLEERPNFPKGVRRATAYLADESATLREQIGSLTRDLAVRDGHVDALESQLSAAREDRDHRDREIESLRMQLAHFEQTALTLDTQMQQAHGLLGGDSDFLAGDRLNEGLGEEVFGLIQGLTTDKERLEKVVDSYGAALELIANEHVNVLPETFRAMASRVLNPLLHSSAEGQHG